MHYVTRMTRMAENVRDGELLVDLELSELMLPQHQQLYEAQRTVVEVPVTAPEHGCCAKIVSDFTQLSVDH